MLAAVALFAVLAAARAQQDDGVRPSPSPITNPCDGNFTALSAAMTNATNTQLAKSFGQTNTSSTDRSTTFTVPRICGPFGTCAGGKTYSASAGKTKSTSGAHDIVSAWTLTEDQCFNNSGTWTVSGTLQVVFTWTDSISVNTKFFVNGFLGVSLDFTVDASITGMTATAGGTWTVTSTNGIVGTLTAISFADCVIDTNSVDITLQGSPLSSASAKAQSKIDASGPQFCTALNNKVAPKLINKTFPLPPSAPPAPSSAMASKTAYELERDRRVEENRAKIAELGLASAAEGLAALAPAKPARKKRDKKEADPDIPVETRRSERPRKEVSYLEFERGPRVEREPVDYSERIKAMTLDAEAAERLRAEMEAKRAEGPKGGKSRGPVDSGRGVRIQGGRVYDSKHGVTCHWCRQKTLEEHVTCTNPNCGGGGGKRMPRSFCAKCLRNRHGEDCVAADASGGWWCPGCRGSCGPGCVMCCNCGPCRKKAGLEPTHQVAKLARDAGFTNVHDYLVHLVTGETPEVVTARKLKHGWGAWLKPDGSDASEQTGGACDGGGGCEEHAHSGQQQSRQRQASESSEQADTAKPADQVGGGPAAAQQNAARGKRAGKGRKPAAKPSASAGKQKAAGGKRKAAEAVEPPPPAEAEEEDSAGAADIGDAPLLSSQDTKLSRKQRIMQRMGLAPVTVCSQ
ncbi:Cdca7l [Scenedesmus sp. PABB004]|nr:Cdca7l [Scenedesmus sp. PABB004]